MGIWHNFLNYHGHTTEQKPGRLLSFFSED
jgi:hypothetical protein